MLFNASYIKLLEGRLSEVQRGFEELVKKFPKSVEVLKAAALAELLRGQKEKALFYLAKAKEQDEEDPFTLFHLGYTYHLLGDSDQAKSSLSATLKREPDFFKKLEELLDRPSLGPLRKLYLQEASASAAHISVPETMLARLRLEGLRPGAAAPQVQPSIRPPSAAGAWEEAPELPRLPAYANIYALVVGVEDYDSQDISPARFAVKDARLFRDLAVKVMGVKDDPDHLLYLENPTLTEFKKALLWVVKKVSSPRRRLILFRSWRRRSQGPHLLDLSGHRSPVSRCHGPALRGGPLLRPEGPGRGAGGCRCLLRRWGPKPQAPEGDAACHAEGEDGVHLRPPGGLHPGLKGR